MRSLITFIICCLLVSSASAQIWAPKPTGKLHVSSVPEGGAVLLDGKPVGKTPVALDSVREGTHIVTILKEGFITVVDTLDIPSGGLKEQMASLDAECVLTVDSDPPEAGVYLNGVLQGRTPLRIGQLRSGQYAVTISRRDYERWTDTVQLMPGVPARLTAKLVPRPAAITVLVPDSSVEVYVNGTSTGFGPAENVAVTSGHVAVKALQRSSGEMVQGYYFLPPGATQTVRAEFNMPSHTAFWYSLIYPGLGQFLNGSHAKGISLGVIFAASLASVVVRQSEILADNAEVTRALGDYRIAVSTRQALSLRGNVQSAYDAVHAAHRARNLSAGIAAGVYLISALDAWFFHDRVSEIVTVDNQGLTVLNNRAFPPSWSTIVTMRISL